MDLAYKDFKAANKICSKSLRKPCCKELKENTMIMIQGNFNKMIEVILKGEILEMYNNRNEKFTNGTQESIWDVRRIN